MSVNEMETLVASLSEAEKARLKMLLETPAPMTDEEWENDAAKKFLDELERQPPLNLPPDFSINHNHYIHGAPKVEE